MESPFFDASEFITLAYNAQLFCAVFAQQQ